MFRRPDSHYILHALSTGAAWVCVLGEWGAEHLSLNRASSSWPSPRFLHSL